MPFGARTGVVAGLLLSVLGTPAVAQIPQSEHDALVAFYTSTGGTGWTSSSGWNGAAGTECTWFGIECDDAQSHVTSILLAENNLSGKLPALAGLPALEQLYVQNNKLSGTIPALTSLTALREVYLNSNQLSGTLPTLSGLNELSVFDADTNALTGSIQALSGLGKLEDFDVENNQLSGSIPALTGLPSLTIFAVDTNSLSGTIPSLSGLSALQGFSAGNNQFSGSIPALSGLGNLQQFIIVGNQLTGSIPSLSGLTSLQGFYAGANKLSGSIPALSGLTHLQRFYADSNELTGSVPDLSGLSQLQYFGVPGNHLSGALPSVSGLSNLISFDVSFNQLSGSIPALAGLANLQTLYLSFNQFTGSIPPLAGLSELQTFDVDNNHLGGSIPALSGLSKLQNFVADDNQLTGAIPALSGLVALVDFNVPRNQLGGPLPALSGLGNLSQFDASFNAIDGPLPALAGLGKLQSLYLSVNQLSGPIPALTGLSALQTIAINDNQLDGSIPSLSGLGNLQNFIAENNQLTGSIPALTGLTALTDFQVSLNQLSGTLPALTGLNNLSAFDASYNAISGPIPSLSGLTNLQEFFVGFNRLTGTIPSLAGLGNLLYFAVDDNLLSGSIPDVPTPNELIGGLSGLCPNNLVPTENASWDAATGLSPWYSTCASDQSRTTSNAPTAKDSTHLALSDDGTIKVFQSQEPDLVAGNQNTNGQDVYSVDADGNAVLEDVDSSGHQMIGTASLPALSPDGNIVAFLFTPSAAKNAKDLATGQMFAGPRGQPKHQVDMGMGSVPPNAASSGAPSLSSVNGVNQLVFCSSASNLVPSDANNARDIFLVDPLNPAIATQRVSMDGTAKELPGDSCEPKLSADGTKLVFSVSAPSLFGTAARQIVRKDLPGAGKVLFTGQILPITTNATGQGASADSSEPTINQDGSVIAFTSKANLDGGNPVVMEAFVSLAHNNGTRLVRRVRGDLAAIPGASSEHPQLSADGTAVVVQVNPAGAAFAADSLAKAGTSTASNACGAIVITTNFFSVTPLGGALCNATGSTVNQNPAISGDGVTTGFDSNAPQSSGSATNRNTYAQGVGANTDVTGNSVANLSGDLSGQWYDPSQNGQGLVIDVTNPDSNNSRLMILTWFVFSNGQPTWVQGVGVPKAGSGSAANTIVVQMDKVGIFRGTSFPLGQAQATGSNWGNITLTFTDANTGSMKWSSSYPGFSSGSMQVKHFLAVGLPAQDAAAAKITSCYSGNWYNPAQVGHGFEFEVLPTAQPLLAVDWFAFSPSGAPVWLQGVGAISGNTAQMHLQLIDGSGAQFPPNFVASGITPHDWGTVTFTFASAAQASVTWNSTIPGYGSGTQSIQPIATGLLDRRGCQ